MPHLAAIAIYPFKSFGPVSVPQSTLIGRGALAHDREYALFDADGKVINAKRTPRIHDLSLSLDTHSETVQLHDRTTPRSACFHLSDELASLEAWLSDFFALSVSVRRDPQGGHPDDLAAPGPTLISTATLEQVASWYPPLTLSECRLRFRANLEIADVPPFWEDRLFSDPDTAVPFAIGDVRFDGLNPCQRCIVPTRHTQTGEPTSDFSQSFRLRREAALPSWANRARFNHFYRLALNTRVPPTELGKTLRVDETIRLLDTSK